MEKPDSIIFDMDGTLWNPMELYLQAWNNGLKDSGVNKLLTAEEIKPLMGVEYKKVLDTILPGYSQQKQQEVHLNIERHRRDLIGKGLGELYPGVFDGLKILADRYKLFILSNCPAGLIRLFMDWAQINEFITDEMAYGVNNMPKSHNMKLLIDKYNLQNPVYVGDTDGDRIQTEMAGLPFIFFSFGFGKAERFYKSYNSFEEFTKYYLSL